MFAVLTCGRAGGTTAVIADLGATSSCTLEGVAALLHAHAVTHAAGAQLRIAAAGPAVQQALQRTGATHVLALYPSVQAAHDGGHHYDGKPGGR